jgi:peptidoglycan/LPS O-acetylase OafA/YrhL
MDKRQTTSLKGICAILILLHHISLYAPQTFAFPISLFQRIGCLVCAVFFLLSRYGIYLSYERDANLFIKGFGKRMAKLLLPFIVWELIYIAWLTFDGETYRISLADGNLFGNWFVWGFIFQYILFTSVWTVCNKTNFTVKWIICLLVTFLLNWFLRDIGWYIFSTAIYHRKIPGKLLGGFAEHRKCSIFALTAFFVYLRVNLKGRLWQHLGGISYYIFLTQFVVFHIFAGNHIYITDKWLFAVASMCTCILFAEVSYYIFRNTKGQVNEKNI